MVHLCFLYFYWYITTHHVCYFDHIWQEELNSVYSLFVVTCTLICIILSLSCYDFIFISLLYPSVTICFWLLSCCNKRISLIHQIKFYFILEWDSFLEFPLETDITVCQTSLVLSWNCFIIIYAFYSVRMFSCYQSTWLSLWSIEQQFQISRKYSLTDHKSSTLFHPLIFTVAIKHVTVATVLKPFYSLFSFCHFVHLKPFKCLMFLLCSNFKQKRLIGFTPPSPKEISIWSRNSAQDRRADGAAGEISSGRRDVFIMLYVHPPSKRGYRH